MSGPRDASFFSCSLSSDTNLMVPKRRWSLKKSLASPNSTMNPACLPLDRDHCPDIPYVDHMYHFFPPPARVHHMNFPFTSTRSTTRGKYFTTSSNPTGDRSLYRPLGVVENRAMDLPMTMERNTSRECRSSGPSGVEVPFFLYT